MTDLGSVDFASVSDTLCYQLAGADLKNDSVITDAKPIERATGALHSLDAPMLDFAVCSLVQCSQNPRTNIDRESLQILSCGGRDDEFPTHKSMFHSRASSSTVYVRSPAASEAFASATARRSSSVVGSSSMGAFNSARTNGSSFSARGIPEVCTRPAALHRESLYWPNGRAWTRIKHAPKLELRGVVRAGNSVSRTSSKSKPGKVGVLPADFSVTFRSRFSIRHVACSALV